ncbi:MAG: WHG domain-containing protein [Chloroflexi bacterium]|nr:WHG domain-containing protein [Chloroflexota bacterium]
MPRKRIDRQRVLEVSIALADAHGFEAVTLASVADQLGIRIPSLYNHVSGLPGLRHDMALWGVRQLGERLRRAAVGKAGDEAIVSVAHAYRAFAHAHPGIYSATLRAATPDEPDLAAAGQEVLDVVLAVLQPYGFDSEDTLHVVRGLRSLLHGFVDLEIAGGFGLALDRDDSFRQLVQLFIQGLHTRQKSLHTGSVN